MLGEASVAVRCAPEDALAKTAGEDTPPRQDELAPWIGTGECPPDALAEAGARLEALWGLEPGKVKVTGWVLGGLATWRDGMEYLAPAGEILEGANAKRLPNPLAPIVQAWLKRPMPVEANTRPDRILPAKLAMVSQHDRRAGRLFSPAAHVAQGLDGGQTVLPGFERETGGPILPLALYDLGAGPPTSRGRGAPLAARLFIEAVLSVPMDSRNRAVVLELSLRDLQERLWPSRKLSRERAHRAIVRAGEVLDTMDARIPRIDPKTGHIGLYRVVDIRALPPRPDSDHPVVLRVHPMPGNGQGPIVTPTLADWGVRDAAGWRGLINLAYRWHNPGVTRYPVGDRQRWVQSNDPERYPELTDDDLVDIFYPTSVSRARRDNVYKARLTVARLEAAGELRVKGRRVLPPGAGARVD